MANTIDFIPRMETLTQAAGETPFSYGQLRRLCLSGKVAYIRLGTKFLINMDSLKRLCEQGEREGE